MEINSINSSSIEKKIPLSPNRCRQFYSLFSCPHVTRIDANILHVSSYGKTLLAFTEDGLIYQVNNSKMTLESVSQNCLQTQGKNWLQNLKNLPIPDGKALPIQGLKGQDKNRSLLGTIKANSSLLLI